ncbi:hypothetical protein [Terricaulis sp.]|uniref:hypothetical protein n=1 Tax=Terricaulis sp. TaxID=2768686 RepID=UPI003783E5C7
MRRLLIATFVLGLAACGQGAGRPQEAAGGGNCALLTDANAIFGADVQAVGQRGIEGMDATCQWTSADGARSGEIVTYTAQSLGSVTVQAKFDETVQKWDAQTETPLAAVEGLGDAAQIATDLPGYQTQIVFRKGDTLVLVMGGSGDSAMSGEQIARAIATQVAAGVAQ